MLNLNIYDDSKNYTCQVINLPKKVAVTGLDNLVAVTYQGNTCLISKDSPEDILYLFFPSETEISNDFLSMNNLYRCSEKNSDKNKKGFFEDNRRVKALKFKGIVSSGFIIPINSLNYLHIEGKIKISDLKVGMEFNELNGIEICKKYYKKIKKSNSFDNLKIKTIDNVVDDIYVPQHFDTEHLFKNIHKLNLNNHIAVTYKLHGTSARYFNAPIKRNLTIFEKIHKFFGGKIQEEEYEYVCGSRKVLKSVGFEQLPNKNHFYKSGDLWSEIGKEYFKDKLLKGEAVYCEIIGKTYDGEDIQSGYSYKLNRPKIYIYRISMINSQGIEIDLSYQQMKIRANQLGVDYCPELFYGKLIDFIPQCRNNEEIENWLNIKFYKELLEKPSILDDSVVEEGFCIRIDKYPKCEIYKIKAKSFLLHESGLKDKEIIDIEEQQI